MTTATLTKVTQCNITRQEFKEHAKDIAMKISDIGCVAEPKQFSTGSLGWFHGGKITLTINGKPVKVQVGINLTIVGSKEAK